jgi:hypothetical protein
MKVALYARVSDNYIYSALEQEHISYSRRDNYYTGVPKHRDWNIR